MIVSFGDRLWHAMTHTGRLCVGIDPHGYLLGEWGLPDTAAGAREFGLRVVAAAAGQVAAVKPQVAFFERFGSAGFAALERVLAEARAAGVLVIADAKRGDVGTSVAAYGEAWLTPGSPLEADALTVAAFQGVGSLAEPFALCERVGKGLFVLAATSNPESWPVQRAQLHGVDAVPADQPQAAVGPRSVAAHILAEVQQRNVPGCSTAGVGSFGVVLGATVSFAEMGIDVSVAGSPAIPVLAPGFGAQGAALSGAALRFGGLGLAALVSESRSVLACGPSGIVAGIRVRADEVRRQWPVEGGADVAQ